MRNLWLCGALFSLANFTAVAQSILVNGGFEETYISNDREEPVGWMLISGTVENNFVSPEGHSGNNAMTFGGDGYPAVLRQTVNTIPGQSYFLSLWMQSPQTVGTSTFGVSWNGWQRDLSGHQLAARALDQTEFSGYGIEHGYAHRHRRSD